MMSYCHSFHAESDYQTEHTKNIYNWERARCVRSWEPSPVRYIRLFQNFMLTTLARNESEDRHWTGHKSIWWGTQRQSKGSAPWRSFRNQFSSWLLPCKCAFRLVQGSLPVWGCLEQMGDAADDSSKKTCKWTTPRLYRLFHCARDHMS